MTIRRLAQTALTTLALLGAACDREARPFQSAPPSAMRPEMVPQTPLQVGPKRASAQQSPYQKNAWGLGEGKRYFTQYNCSGCHANGGGGIGPALMDDEWIYGYEPDLIYETIVQGRPNGMPAFGGRIPDNQVWQLVAYVLSMSGQSPIDAAPGRSDHMQTRTPEMATPYQGRRQTGHK
jgi:cytochrome c oxidase cbb3-type subunit 3